MECGVVLWSQRGALLATLVAKTAYSLGPGVLAQVAPEPVSAAEPAEANERGICELVPRLPKAEVLHVGAVFAPAGVTMVRLALVRAGQPVFEKRKLAKVADGSPGLGALGRASPERRAALRGAREPEADGSGVLALAPDYDFSFHQVAPADQRVDRLLPGDQLVLGNLHPDVAELVVALPSRGPAARALLGSQAATLAFECKRVLLDTDRKRMTLTWLAELTLPGLHAVPHVLIEARAPEPSAPVAPAFDARSLLRQVAPGPVPAPALAKGAGAPPPVAVGTVLLDEPAPAQAGTLIVDEGAVQHRTLPFAGGSSGAAARVADASATPWGGPLPVAPRAPVAAPGAGTMALDVDEPPAPRLPPPPAPPPPVPPVAASPALEPPPAPPSAPAADARKSDPWAKLPEAAQAPPPPPSAPKAEPRANALKLLYKKLK